MTGGNIFLCTPFNKIYFSKTLQIFNFLKKKNIMLPNYFLKMRMIHWTVVDEISREKSTPDISMQNLEKREKDLANEFSSANELEKDENKLEEKESQNNGKYFLFFSFFSVFAKKQCLKKSFQALFFL